MYGFLGKLLKNEANANCQYQHCLKLHRAELLMRPIQLIMSIFENRIDANTTFRIQNYFCYCADGFFFSFLLTHALLNCF